MLNSQFMTALAKLESVAATSAEQETINAVRGRYVAKFGTEHPYVAALNKLESVAATDAEKAEINKIRGKFGLFEMTGNLNKQNPELLDYADDELYNEGDTGSSYDEELTRKNMSEEDRLSDKYGTHMSVVGDEIVRDLDPEVRQQEDDADKDERWRKDFDEYERLSFDEDDEEKNERNKFYLTALHDDAETFRELTIDRIIDYIKMCPCELKELYKELGEPDFTQCVRDALKASIVKFVPVKYIEKIPKQVNGKQLLQKKVGTVYVPAFQLDKDVYFVTDRNIYHMLRGNTDNYQFDHRYRFISDDHANWMHRNVSNRHNIFASKLLNSDRFMDLVNQTVEKRKDMLGDGLDIDGVYGTMAPDTKTPEDAYSDFAESHAYATDEEDPYSKYN